MAGAPDASGAAGVARAMTQWRTLLLQASGRMLDLLLPPQCICCDAAVEVQGQFCAACFGHTDFITEPCCARCGVPFGAEAAGRRRCRLPLLPRVAAAVRTGAGGAALQRARPPPDPAAEARRPAGACRHAGAAHGARRGSPVASGRPAGAGAAAPPAPVPPPLQPGGPAGCAPLPALPVSRRCPTRWSGTATTDSLDMKSPAERTAEVRDAFAPRPRRAGLLAGRAIVLIDDVMTSGATANACAAVLLAGGARSVDVLLAARVPDPRLN